MYVQARRAKKLLFLASICRAQKIKMTPRSRKSGYGLLVGCISGLDAGPFEKNFVWPCSCWNKKKREIFTVCSGPASQSIGRGRISREGALDVRESRERRDKIVPIFSLEKRNFGLKFYTFFEQDRWFSTCCSRESTSVWQNFRQKQPKKKKKKKWGLRFF